VAKTVRCSYLLARHLSHVQSHNGDYAPGKFMCAQLTDRTWKLKNYRAYPAIEEYIVVDLQSLKIESYHK
jgi:hypothetical protein